MLESPGRPEYQLDFKLWIRLVDSKTKSLPGALFFKI